MWISRIFGPIFVKEMLEVARRKRYYFNRVFYGAILLLTLFIIWEEFQWRFRVMDSRFTRYMSELAETIFIAVSGLQYGAVFLFVPLFLAGAIASEREEKTLDLLFTTDLSNREIVIGKLTSRLVTLLFLFMTSLPILSLLMLFGGITPAALWRTLAATFLAMVFAGAHAIYFSVTTKSVIGALVRTYWWLLFWNVGVPMAVMMIGIPIYRRSPMLIEYMLAGIGLANPLGSFIPSIIPDAYLAMNRTMGTWVYPTTYVIPSVVSLVLIWRAAARLRLEPRPFAAFLKRLYFIRNFISWRTRVREARRSRLRDQQVATRESVPFLGRLFGSTANPVWHRSQLTHVYDREGHLRAVQTGGWLLAILFFGIVAATEPRALRHEEGPMSFVTVSWIAVAVLATLIAAASIAADRRRGFFELVLTTPISASQIVAGTYAAVWEHMRRLFWLPLVLTAIFVCFGASHLSGAICSLISAVLFCSLLVVCGVACSLAARSVPAALLPSFAFPIMMNIGMPIWGELFRKAAGPALWIIILISLPLSILWVYRRSHAAAVGTFLIVLHLALTALATCWTHGTTNYFPLGFMHPGYMTIVFLLRNFDNEFRYVPWFAVTLCYWLALILNIVVVYLWTVWNFDRLAGRIPQRSKSTLIMSGDV